MLVVPVELEGRGRGAGGGDPGGFGLARLGTGDRLRAKAPCPRSGGGEPGGRGTRGAYEGRSGGSWDDAVTERARRLFLRRGILMTSQSKQTSGTPLL